MSFYIQNNGGERVSYQVPAVANAARILQYLQQTPKGARLRDIATALAMNKSTGHNILKTMEDFSLVAYDQQTRLYRLGISLLTLGAAAAGGMDTLRIARTAIEGLVEEIRFTVLIGQLLASWEVVVVDKVETPMDIKVTAAVGERFPISAAAFGKCFLAWRPEEEAERVLRECGLPAYTKSATTDVKQFMAELAEVRRLGYSRSVSEYYANSNAVAAPVFNADGNIAFALCALASTADLTEESVPAYGLRLKATADAITLSIGGRSPATAQA